MIRIRSILALAALVSAAAACDGTGNRQAPLSDPGANRSPRVAARQDETVQTVLSAYIYGPSPVQKFDECEWVAVASGGTPPYTYSWHAGGGAGTATDETFFGYLIGSTMYLTVKVKDSVNDSVSVTRTILGNFNAPLC